MVSVNGIYENGEVKLLENPPTVNGSAKVVVTFLEEQNLPVSHFKEEDFWNVIHLVNWDETVAKRQILPCINELTRHSTQDIIQFEEILAEKLFLLDGKRFAPQNLEHFSVDDFLYLRCFAVAKGKEYYYGILENNQALREEAFEPLLYIGERAYNLLTNRDLALNTKFSYETYSNYQAWDLTEPVSLY
jgi:hypothetical protein